MNGLKVVFLFTPGPIGGAEKIILHGLEALKDQIQNLELWILKEEKNFEVTHQFLKLIERVGVNYRVYNMESAMSLNALRELREDFRTHAPDIVHTHGIKAAIFGKLAANKEAKFIISHHAPHSYSFKEKFFESVEKSILKKADAIITASDKVKADLLNSNVPTEKLPE
jgi:dihydroorotase-like cyclic amidohydrolase